MNQVLSKVFMWLFVGLALTFGVAYVVSNNDTMLYNIFSTGMHWILFIVELVVVIVLSVRIRKMSTMTATILYLLYSGLTGLTFSSIFVLYELTSIIYVFAIAAVLFLLFGLIGYFTKLDLSKLGTYLFMGLIGLLLAYIVNIFIGSEAFDLGLAAIGIIIFLGFIAYDIHVIKRNLYGIENDDNLAIYGAFQLYIDFINIFIDLLRLFGKSRD